jgi:hypothetical protein
MTYTRKGINLRAEVTLRPSRDLLWVQLNGYNVLNIHRQPLQQDTLQYVTTLTPPSHSLIGGDLNARHEQFEPGTVSTNGGTELAYWGQRESLDFIGEPGVPTHRLGHVLDLTFSNIPFADTIVRTDMHSGSDHATQVTTIPARGQVTPAQVHYRVPMKSIWEFNRLLRMNITGIKPPERATTTEKVETCIKELNQAVEEAIIASGHKETGRGHSAPWWTEEVQGLCQRHIQNHADIRAPPTDETRDFLAAVRRAKRTYWQKRIDGICSDKELYDICRWHKLTSNQQSAPLVVNGETTTDTREKAEALRLIGSTQKTIYRNLQLLRTATPSHPSHGARTFQLKKSSGIQLASLAPHPALTDTRSGC